MKKLLILILISIISIFMYSCKETPAGDIIPDIIPDISAESITVSGIVTDAFPTVIGGFEIRDTYGKYFTGLSPSDFPSSITEETLDAISKEYLGSTTFPFNVEVNLFAGTSKVDIVLILDVTGSMGGEITDIINNINAFADALASSGIDFLIGCVTFGDTYGDTLDGGWYGAVSRPYMAPTSDIVAFKAFMNSLSANGGGDSNENFIDAIDYARTAIAGDNPEGSFQTQAEFNYRPDAKKVFIGITDISYQTPSSPGNASIYYADGGPYNSSVYNTMDDESTHLQADDISTYIVSPTYYQDIYEDFAFENNGAWINMDTDFSNILDKLSTTISSNYLFRFTTTDLTLGTIRTITFKVAGITVTIEYEILGGSAGAAMKSIITTPTNNNN